MQEIIKPSNELMLITVEEQNQVILIDPKTRGILEQYIDEQSQIQRNTLCVAPKSQHILGMQNQKTLLNIWNMENKKVFLKISCSEKLTATSISPSELYFAGASISGYIYIWETYTGKLLKKHKAHQRKINCISFSQDEGLIITAADDGICNVFFLSALISQASAFKVDLNNGIQECKSKFTLIGHTEKINSIQMSKQGINRLYTCSSDKTIIIWDLFKGQKLKQISLESEIMCLEIDFQEMYAYAGCSNGQIYKINIENDSDKTFFQANSQEITNLKFFDEDQQIISTSRDGLIIFWSTDGEIKKTLNIFNKSINNLCLFPRINYTNKKLIFFKPFHRFEQEQNQQQEEQIHKFIMPKMNSRSRKIKKISNQKYSNINQIILSIEKEDIQEKGQDDIINKNLLLKIQNHQKFNQMLINSNIQ